MSTSVGVNVLRWSALGLGVFYGLYHQAQISAKDKLAQVNREYKHKEDLIAQARAEWQKSHTTEQPKSQGAGKEADPKDPNADYHQLLGIKDE